MKSEDASERTLTIKKKLNASIQTVWKAWTQPEHIGKWWGRGMEVKVLQHDFRVGGKWKYSMAMPNGGEFISDGVYLEIVEYKRIISTANFKPMTEGVQIQALFEEDGNKTNFTFNVVHPTVEYCKQQEKMGFYNGWGSVFNTMEDYLKRIG